MKQSNRSIESQKNQHKGVIIIENSSNKSSFQQIIQLDYQEKTDHPKLNRTQDDKHKIARGKEET